MSETRRPAVLCLASYEKGADFLRELRRQGCHVMLLTVERLRDAPWPHDSIDEFLVMPSMTDRQAVVNAVSYLARTREIDKIVALEDYDVQTAAALREHLRCPGMGDTTARYFRDKLAMRVQALDKGLAVPPFVPVLNHTRIHDFTQRVPPPWMLKPRSDVATIGIHKINNADELWSRLDGLGDRQSYYVLEKYVPGDVYHVDSIVYGREILFAEAHRYGTPPFDVTHGGGLSMSSTLPRDGADALALRDLNARVLAALNFLQGVTHTEFIKAHEDGRFYFLETAARVGGAYIVNMMEAATGLNMWAEWAKVELATDERPYKLPEHREDYAGIIISLSRQEWPDTSAYNDPEIAWRLDKLHHAGLVVVSPDPERVQALLADYARRFYEDFHAAQPPLETPP
jgi:biotin carboxylase